MSKKNNCYACELKKKGAKSILPVYHTCGQYPPEAQVKAFINGVERLKRKSRDINSKNIK